MDIVTEYQQRQRYKKMGLSLTALVLLVTAAITVTVGAMDLEWSQLWPLSTDDLNSSQRILLHVRLPRLCSAILGGASLALSGLVLQIVLQNPLASPSTLGISQGAAFGAACGIWLLSWFGNEPLLQGLPMLHHSSIVTIMAFAGALTTTLFVMGLAAIKKCRRETIILAGVALSALFIAATTLLQYLADETQLAAIIHWSFGDVGRAGWKEIAILAPLAVFGVLFFFSQRRQLNALLCGNDTAATLGVNINRWRVIAVTIVATMTAVTVSFLGVISFIGLVAPHICRMLVGEDTVSLLPLCVLVGAILLLFADTLGRTLMPPLTFPAGIITAFLGAPLFLVLLFGRENVWN